MVFKHRNELPAGPAKAELLNFLRDNRRRVDANRENVQKLARKIIIHLYVSAVRLLSEREGSVQATQARPVATTVLQKLLGRPRKAFRNQPAMVARRHAERSCTFRTVVPTAQLTSPIRSFICRG